MQFLRDIVVPIILIGLLVFMSFVSISEWVVYSIMFLSYILIVFQMGSWGKWGFYTRRFIVLLFLVGLMYSYKDTLYLPLFSKDVRELYWQIFVDAIILSGLIYYNINIYLGKKYNEKPISLDFPLIKGKYLIADGGSNHYVNHHIKGKYFVENKISQAMTYALDIQKLSPLGTESKVINPQKADDYACFGERVYSPCDGEILEVTNDVSDDFTYDFENPKGNHIVIKHGDVYVVMLHFKQGTIEVKEGDKVRRGQFLGEIGNSGLVKRPNLHIQATVGSPWFGEGIPILFDGKFLARNMIVSKN